MLGNMLSSEVKRYAAESQQQQCLEEGMVHIKMASVLFCLNDHPAVAEHIITYTSYFDKSMPDASEEHLEDRSGHLQRRNFIFFTCRLMI